MLNVFFLNVQIFHPLLQLDPRMLKTKLVMYVSYQNGLQLQSGYLRFCVFILISYVIQCLRNAC